MIEKKATEGNPSVAFFFPFYFPSTQKGMLRSMVFVKKKFTFVGIYCARIKSAN